MTYTAKKKNSMPIPVEPAVLPVIVQNSAAESNVLVPIPWKYCELVHAVAIVTTAIDATGGMSIKLELNAAGGTEMMTIVVPASSAAGTNVEGTISNAAACRNLDRDCASRDAVNIEVDGSANAAGEVQILMYFGSSKIGH